ncbi:MAG: hypothetical protein ACYTEX_14090 [Planctomycetota bacterium]
MADEQNNSESQENGQSKDAIKALKAKLRCDNVSAARHAAFNLSWLQEDGFEALKEALLGEATKRTKAAAAYGLRKTHGRMKKMARELFEQGCENDDEQIREICKHALQIMTQPKRPAPPPRNKRAKEQAPRIPIKTLQGKRPRTVKDFMNEAAAQPNTRKRKKRRKK